jgi:PPP family 3-phenylpropionic acid transporter
VLKTVQGAVLSNTRTRPNLAVLYFLFYLPSGLLKGSLASFLVDSGITLNESGIIISAMFFAKLALSPFIAAAYDKAERKTRYLSLVAGVGSVGALALIASNSFVTLFAATLMLIVARNFFQSIMDSTAAHLETRRTKRSSGFGSARFAGSISVSIGSLLMVAAALARIDARESFAMIVAGFSVLYFVAVFLSLGAATSCRSRSEESVPEAGKGSPLSASYQLQIVLCLVSGTLLIGTLGAIYSTGSVSLRATGISDTGIQLLWCLAFTSEAFVFYFSNRLLLWLGSKVILFTLIAGLTRWLMLALFPSNLFLISLSFLLQGFVFALPQSYFVTTVHRLADRRWSATVQTIYIGVTQGVGISLFSLLTQIFYTHHGPSAWLIPCGATLLGCTVWSYLWLCQRSARANPRTISAQLHKEQL